MRLIDADALLNELGDIWKIPKDWDGDIDETCETAFDVIENAPTVEAIPVVHGEWKIGSKPRCSVCGKSALREYDLNDWLSYVPSNFCPNCGADMRKKVEE